MKFPEWKPQKATKQKINSPILSVRYKALRSSSSSFIKRIDVRSIIFRRDGYSCQICGRKENLTIDHIHSVYEAAHGKYPVELLNTEDNLQTLCCYCNERKAP